MRPTACVIALCSVLLGAPTAPAVAGLPDEHHVVPLPTSAFRDLAVDTRRGRVFVSDGSDLVLVRDQLGKANALLPDQPGAAGLALAPDGDTLYVALSAGHAISAIDAETLVERERYDTGPGTCPATLTATPGYVWFGYGCARGTARVGVLDLTGQAPAVAHDVTRSAYLAPPSLVVPEDRPDRLVVGSSGAGGSSLAAYGTAGTALTPVATADPGGALADVAAAPGGGVVTAAGSEYHWRRFRADTLAPDGGYGGRSAPTALAVHGDFVAAGGAGADAQDVHVYASDGTLVRRLDLGAALEPGGLAFGAHGALLYAVAGDALGGARELHVLRHPTRHVTTMTLAPPATATIGDPLGVDGALSSATPVPAGTFVYLTRTSAYGTVRLPEVTTGATGGFGIGDLVTRRGSYTYTATYYGDHAHAPVERSVTVGVRGYVPSLTLSTDHAAYAYGATATVTARLGSTYTNRVLAITAQPYGGTRTTIASGRVGSDGVLRATYVMRQRTTFRARFGGDALYEPRTVARAATAQVVLRQQLSGHTAYAAGTHYFAGLTRPVLRVGVHPSRAGSCVVARLDAYRAGAWRTVESRGCVELAWDSTAHLVFEGSYAKGVRHRLRASFAGDAHNALTHGGWLYLTFA